MKLLKFTQFITEARISSHGEGRIDQRIYNLESINLPKPARQFIRESGFDINEVYSQLIEAIKSEFKKSQDHIEQTQFPSGHKALPVVAPFLKVEGARYPVTMAVKSFSGEAGREIEKVHTGERVFAYISDDVLTTIKVLPHGMSHKDIKIDLENHLSRKGKVGSVHVYELPEESVNSVFELTEDGQVIPEKRITFNPKILSGEQQYSVAAGRKIKVFIPFLKDFAECTIESLLNRDTFREDRFLKLGIVLPDGRKIAKTLNPGDAVELPIGENGDWVRAKISDSLYVYDKRTAEPVSLKAIPV